MCSGANERDADDAVLCQSDGACNGERDVARMGLWSGSADGWPVGEVACFARAQDNEGAWSELAGVVVTVASWQNPLNPFDVDGDGTIEPLDVLRLINEINRDGARDLPPRTADDFGLPFFDVSGDERLDALDVLLVINYINSQLSGGLQTPPDGWGEGEGDGVRRMPSTPAGPVASTWAESSVSFGTRDTRSPNKALLSTLQACWDEDELLDELLNEPWPTRARTFFSLRTCR
jgi:hypothetical protein